MIGSVIARAVSACGYRVRVSCVVVEFRRLGMFTLGQGLLLFRQAHRTLVSGVFHQDASCAEQSETGLSMQRFSLPLAQGSAGLMDRSQQFI
jgi:hypothetical protein